MTHGIRRRCRAAGVPVGAGSTAVDLFALSQGALYEETERTEYTNMKDEEARVVVVKKKKKNEGKAARLCEAVFMPEARRTCR